MRKKTSNKLTKATARKRKKHPLRTFFSLLAIFIACFLIYMAGDDLITTFRLKQEISNNEELIGSLEEQKSSLSQEKTNLEDPDYVKRYARGKYMVSKPGEQVFKLPSRNSNEDE